MKRPSVNFLIDCFGFVLLAGLVLTGVILKWVLPPGTGGNRGGRGGGEVKEYLSLTRHEWGHVHFWLSVLFVVIIVVHLIYHYKWIKAYIKSRWSGGA